MPKIRTVVSYLSIRQPFAWLILEGLKDIENRGKAWSFRGELFIHASSNRTNLEDDIGWVEEEHGIEIPRTELVFGAFIGTVEMTDCVDDHPSEWFSGDWGYVLANPRRIVPIPYKANAGPQKARDLEVRYLKSRTDRRQG